MQSIRVGIVGLGANTRLRHVPGLLGCPGVEIVGVCNRSEKSTYEAAREFSIPKTYPRWQELVADDQIDAVVVGTWPYLHRDVTLAGLQHGKHVLTEARMARNLAEAREMLDASRLHPDLVTQIVPSPFGLRGDRVVKELLSEGYLGQLREIVLLGVNNAVADPDSPLHWRQVAELNGLNTLALGILHETLIRWVPGPTRVFASAHTFVEQRSDPEGGPLRPVESPDHLCVLTELPGGARGTYHLSGAVHFGPGMQIHLYGTEGTLKYQLAPEDRLIGARKQDQELRDIEISPERAGGWRVEEEFVAAIRGEETVRFTDFETGVRYMEFTEAVSRSAKQGTAVDVKVT
jgi:predicted dehydrogenase